MILSEVEVKQYIPVTTLTVSYLEKHESRAMLKHLPKYLGIAQTKLLMVAEPTAANLLLINELKGAIANLAYCEAVPFIDLVSTNTGFGVVSNTNIAPASQQRVKAFADAALKAAEDYLSDALLFLETNSTDYPDWNKSSLIEGGLIESIDSWPTEIDINYSRVKFVNLVPFIKQAERLYIAKKLSSEFVASIAGTADVDVLPDIQKALAFSALFLKEKSQLEESSALNKFNAKNMETAMEYLNSCIDFLNKNLESYPVYAEFGYAEPFINNLDDYGFIQMG